MCSLCALWWIHSHLTGTVHKPAGGQKFRFSVLRLEADGSDSSGLPRAIAVNGMPFW
jgi:hypothetical protein